MFRLFTLFLLIFNFVISDSTASVTLLITGHSSNNVYKHQLASFFVDSYEELIKGSKTPLFVFTNGVSMPVASEINNLLETWNDLDMPTNVSTLILTNLGTDEMSLDHLSVIQRFMKTKKPLIVIEIGNPAVQTGALLNRSASCLSGGHAVILSPNAVYFCNEASPNMLPNLQFDDLYEITAPNLESNWEEPQTVLLMPNIFVSAAKGSEKRHHGQHEHHHHEHHHHPHQYHHHHHKHQLEENVDEIVDQIMEDIMEEGVITPPPKKKKTKEFNELKEGEKKMFCKYRKSCYETGEKPQIDDSFLGWLFEKRAVEEEVKVHQEPIEYNSEDDLVHQKFLCKYRVSCYHERGIPISEKVADKEKKMVLASKKKPQQGKKKTLKEIAAKTLQDVKEAEEKAAKRPVVQVVKTKLDEIEEKLQEKLNCKYRKSCYETGQKPVIEDAWRLPSPIKIFSMESADTVNKQINYSELEELEKKVYCKYRKSCYETGVKPEIEPEIFIRTIADLTTLHEQVETRKLTLQEKCKYRKSCYETGIVPEINPKLEAAIQREVSSVIPTNVQDLKMLCKYRKSCYAEIHDSATVDTIKIIRKRRQIEKEVKRRKARRAKLHRRLRGEMQLGHWRKPSRRAAAGGASRKDVESAKLKEAKVDASPEKQEKIEEEDADKEKESVVSETKKGKSRRGRQQAPKDIVQDANVQEEVESAMTEPPEKEMQPKKQRKTRKAKVEESQDEPKPVVKKAAPPVKTGRKPTEDATAKESTQAKQTTEIPEREKPTEAPKPATTKEQRKKKEVKPRPKQAEEKEVEKEEKNKSEDEETAQNVSGTPKKSKMFGGAKEAMKKMIDEMHHQQGIQETKEYCKYRKSCYASGKRPKIEKTVGSIVASFAEHNEKMEKAIEEEEAAIVPTAARKKTETDKKLECKYRKSCYETGILPEIKAPQEAEEQGIVFKAGISKQLQCKYKKSCYKEAGIIAAADEVADTEEKRKPSDQRAKTADDRKESIKNDEDTTIKKPTKEERASTEQKKRAEIGKSEEECQSGKACYTSADPKAMKEDHAGSMARIGLERFRKNGKCSPYYYSCREVLGLPKKEKAPIGPNGKRLCRKKPKSL